MPELKMNIIEIISPLIFIACLGFMCAKTKWLSKNQLDGISKLTFNLCIPAFLFSKMVTAKLVQNIELSFFLAFYLPVITCYFIAGLSNYFFHKKPAKNYQASAVFALASSYSNTVIIGLPILFSLYGEQAMLLIFAIVTFHSAMLFTLTSALAAKENKTSWKKTLANTFKNPLLISILGGALFNLFNIPLGEIINQSLSLLAKPAIALALFVLGASLSFYPLKNEVKFVSLSSSIKLVLLPFFVYISSYYLFNLDSIQLNTLVILSACPTGVNAYLIARNFHSHEQTAASTVVVTTLLSVFSLSFWLWWLT